MRYRFGCCGIPTKMPQNPLVFDDGYLTPLYQDLQLNFIQHMDRIKYVGLILNVL